MDFGLFYYRFPTFLFIYFFCSHEIFFLNSTFVKWGLVALNFEVHSYIILLNHDLDIVIVNVAGTANLPIHCLDLRSYLKPSAHVCVNTKTITILSVHEIKRCILKTDSYEICIQT